MKHTDHRRRTEVAVRDRDLGAPQPFPLTGDGQNTGGLYDRVNGHLLYKKQNLGAATAEARYRDWLERKRRIGSE